MNGKPVAIVLGGIVPHKNLLEKLKKRGYYTILIDYFENPPAAEAADLHVRESAMEKEAVVQIARQYGAELVLCTCLDQQIGIACAAAEELGLPRPYSREKALEVTNKEKMKRVMREHNIPTSRYFSVHSAEEVYDAGLHFPVMVKPADSCGSAGIRKVESYEEIPKAVEQALSWSRSGTAVVEEFVTGTEISVYTFITGHKAHVLLTSQRFSELGEDGTCIKCYASVAPAVVSDRVLEAMEELGTKIAEAFELDNTAMFYQCMVKNGDIQIIEFAPRISGGIAFRTIEENTGFDIINAAIDSWLGIPVKMEYHKPEVYNMTQQIHAKPCIFDHIEGAEQLKEAGILDTLFLHKTKGAHVDNDKASSARVAAALVRTKNREELPGLAKAVVEGLEVYDDQGREVGVKDLYLREEDISEETQEEKNAAESI